MNELLVVGIFLAALIGSLLAFAPRLSESLVRAKARRLPEPLSARMGEEWLAELGALPGRSSQLAFAVALTLTRRHSFALDDDSLLAGSTRSRVPLASFGGWPSVILLTTVAAAGLAYAASFLIQPLYRSHARIAIVSPQIPSRFVEPVVTKPLAERLHTLKTAALSRTRLEKVILDFGIDRSTAVAGADRRGGTPKGGPAAQDQRRVSEAAIERMQRDLSVEAGADGQSFEVAYVSPNPRTAMLVTERVMALLIKENSTDRHGISRSAMQFLNAQIQDVRSRLLQDGANEGSTRSNQSDADVRALERESLRQTYRNLLLQKEQAILSEQMEAAQIGEQFRVLDGARLPNAPLLRIELA